MKKITILLLCWLFSAVVFCQTHTTTFKLYVQDCRDKAGFSRPSGDMLMLFKLPEDKMIQQITIPNGYGAYLTTIGKLPVSEYKLIFKNKFDQKITKQIALTRQDTNAVYICLDSLSAYPKNTLATLLYADNIAIDFRSTGCFHSSQKKITITRYQDSYVARLYSFVAGEQPKNGRMVLKNTGAVLLKTVTLTEENIATFIRFENELSFMGVLGCTTVDTYTIKSKYLNFTKTDGSCNWRGFGYLLQSFFGDVK